MITFSFSLATAPEPEAPPEPTPDPPAGVVWGLTDADGDPTALPTGDLDAVTTALNRIWKQFQGRETWTALFGDVFGAAFAEVESQQLAIANGRSVSTAVGVQLDAIGRDLIGRQRGGLTNDDDYRLAIIADAVTLESSGTMPEIVDFAVRLVGDGVRVRPYYPAVVYVQAPDLDADSFALFASIMADVPAASISLMLSTYPSETTGGWGSVHGSVSTFGVFSSIHGPTTNERAHWSSARGLL